VSAQSALKIGVLFNCQHETLAIALRALLPHAEVISYELASVHRDPALPAVIHAALTPPPLLADRLAVLRQYAARLARLRDAAEAP